VTADKQLRARRRAEQIRASKASRAKKMPDRRGPKQTEELKELRRVGRQTVQDRYKCDTGRQLKKQVK
jgi:hypothetical protein